MIALNFISYIYYFVKFQIKKKLIKALINVSNKVNAITSVYVKKLVMSSERSLNNQPKRRMLRLESSYP